MTIRDNATFSTGVNNFDLHNSTAAAAISVLNLNGGSLTVGGFIKTRTGSTQFATNNLNGGLLKAGANNSAFLPALSGLTTLVKSGGAKIDDNGFSITIAAPLIHDSALGATADGGLTKLGGAFLSFPARTLIPVRRRSWRPTCILFLAARLVPSSGTFTSEPAG